MPSRSRSLHAFLPRSSENVHLSNSSPTALLAAAESSRWESGAGQSSFPASPWLLNPFSLSLSVPGLRRGWWHLQGHMEGWHRWGADLGFAKSSMNHCPTILVSLATTAVLVLEMTLSIPTPSCTWGGSLMSCERHHCYHLLCNTGQGGISSSPQALGFSHWAIPATHDKDRLL